jgi:uncharacterized membrane protein YqjE
MPEHPGLLDSAKRLLATLAGIVAARLELLANEWQEERLRLAQILFLALFAAFCFCMGLVLLALFIVVLLWDEHRLAALGVLSLVFLGSAAWMGIWLQNKLRYGSKLFSVSLAELTKDRRSLGDTHE